MRSFSAARSLLRRWWAEACAPAPPFPLCEDEWAGAGLPAGRRHALGAVLEAVRQHRAHERLRQAGGLVRTRAGWAVPAPGTARP